MYQASVPTCLRFLTALSAILGKAAEHARQGNQDPSEMLNARLAPDMLPLSQASADRHRSRQGNGGAAFRA
jgi:hypothetical protein